MLLKKKIYSLSKDLEDFLKEKEVVLTCGAFKLLKNENASLIEKDLDLTKIVYKFTNGKKFFEIMLGRQKCIFDKGGIGYKFLKQKLSQELFCQSIFF